jgi:uncharacterized Tic20 family protein
MAAMSIPPHEPPEPLPHELPGAQQPSRAPFPQPLQQDETIWALLAQLSGLVGLGVIGPLIIMLVAGPQRPFAKAAATEALNFHLTVLFAVIVSVVLVLVIIGIFLLLAVSIAALIYSILAAIAVGRGETYRYPLTIRLVS